MTRRNHPASSNERGAVLVELAIVAPLLLILFLGVVELGLRTQSSQSVVGATRSAARVASSAGDDRLADFTALQALAGALDGYQPSAIQRIIIFDAGAADGSMPTGCESGPVAGSCNHYIPAHFSLGASAFAIDGASCSALSPDASWCPMDRQATQYPAADWIGVEVWVQHQSIAPFLPNTTIKETTVMRLEPRFGT